MSDNVLSGVALEFRGAAAIFAGYVASANIEHNTILDTGYTGCRSSTDGPMARTV